MKGKVVFGIICAGLLAITFYLQQQSVSYQEQLSLLEGRLEEARRKTRIKEEVFQARIAKLQGELAKVSNRPVDKMRMPEIAPPSVDSDAIDAGSAFEASAKQTEQQKEATQPLALQQEGKFQESVEYLIDARVGAISRIVALSGDQERRLREKFLAEREAALEGRFAETESLQKILGEEYLDFYERQKAEAFEKNKQEELKKQVLFLSDMLQFSPDQEITLYSMFESIEDEIDEKHKKKGKSIQELVASSRFRQARRLERISKILSAEQLKKYADYSAASPDSDMIMWHAPPDENE